jgi:hypothetical protein
LNVNAKGNTVLILPGEIKTEPHKIRKDISETSTKLGLPTKILL